MKKIIILITILFVSCGEKQVKNDVVKFWHFWSEPNQKLVLDSIITEFTKQTKIEIETTELSWNDGKTKLFAAFNSGTGPDVLELGSDWVAQFSYQGVLEKQQIDVTKFIKWSTTPIYGNDKQIYATPWIVDTRIMFYNKELLDRNNFEPATSYEEIFTQCQAINNDGFYGFGLNGPDRNRLYKKALMFLWSAGGDVIEEGKSIINSPENIFALDFYNKLKSVGVVESQKNLDLMFLEGKIAYNISGGWLLTKIINENPDLNFGIMNMPPFKLKGKGVAFAGGEYLSINNSSKQKLNAQKLIDYLTDGKNSIAFCKKVVEAGFPADKNYYNNKFYHNHPYRSIISKQLENCKMTPIHPNWLEIQDELEATFERVLYDKEDPKISLKNAHKSINSILNQ